MMDTNRFDALAKAFGKRVRSRRTLIGGAVVAAVAQVRAGRDGIGSSASRRVQCRRGKEACGDVCCDRSDECVANLGRDRRRRRTCCSPDFIFRDDLGKDWCCPANDVCEHPTDRSQDLCCNHKRFACLPDGRCCPNDQVCGNDCCLDCCPGGCCGTDEVCACGVCRSAQQTCEACCDGESCLPDWLTLNLVCCPPQHKCYGSCCSGGATCSDEQRACGFYYRTIRIRR